MSNRQDIIVKTAKLRRKQKQAHRNSVYVSECNIHNFACNHSKEFYFKITLKMQLSYN